MGVVGSAPFLIFGAPGSVGTLRSMAGPAPVPLAAITEQHLHPQPLLETKFKSAKQSGTRLSTHPDVSLSDHPVSGNIKNRYSSVDTIVLKYVRTPD